MQIDKNLAIKIGVGVVAVIVILALVSSLFALARALLPVALVGVLLYVGYRWYTGQQEAKSSGSVVSTASRVQPEAKEQTTTTADQTAETELESWEKDEFTAQVERLAEKERRLQEEQDDAPGPDELRAQLEERKRRLGLDGEQ